MRFPTLILLAAALAGAAPASLAAGGFAAKLDVAEGSHKQTASNDPPPKGKPAPARPTFDAPVEGRVRIVWKITRTANDPAKDVLVHCYVVRTTEPNEPPPALNPADVLLESALTMDFDPKTSTSADLVFRPDKPGTYLIRVDAEGSAEQTSAAIDVIVK
jgi:hypothetical protein